MANTNLLISKFLSFQTQIRSYHWMTDSYSKHKAFGKTYDNLDELIDSFIETYFGIFGKDISDNTNMRFSISLVANETSIYDEIYNFIEFLNEFGDVFKNNPDLLNIRDEILASVNQLKYLLSLN